MHHSNWFLWLWGQLDLPSLRWCGGTITLAVVTHITANEVSLFFTVLVGTTAAILNIVKTKIAQAKEKDRKQREVTGLPPIEDDD